ncbi:MAG: AraC family transcriptional regulator [Firmicutes bacterium]|nr:AraC family transcriptional regulator [Bacillota bacterium]
MEWLTSIRSAIDFMEKHLEEDISAQDVADQVYLSSFFLQKGFSLMTGYGIGEYIRSRRLYKAALDLKNTKERVIDIALKYGYETPESFSKAFSRFHGVTPVQAQGGAAIRTFLPLKIEISVQGGSQMDCRIMTMDPFTVIGYEKEFDSETAYQEIPKFWNIFLEKFADGIFSGKEPACAEEKAIIDNRIGEYAICVDDIKGGRFRYLIAGMYMGGEVPEGMTIYEVPKTDWAVFSCVGPLPDTLQDLNTRIYKEWLPGNPEYELCGNATVEWYGAGDTTSKDYQSAIWIPVKKRGQQK